MNTIPVLVIAFLATIFLCGLAVYGQADPRVLETTRSMGMIGTGLLSLFLIGLAYAWVVLHQRNISQAREKARNAPLNRRDRKFVEDIADTGERAGNYLWIIMMLVILSACLVSFAAAMSKI